MLQKWLFTFIVICFSLTAYATPKALVLTIDGIIGPATEDYVIKNLQLAKEQQAKAVILEINTPGGLESSMTAINDAILSSPIPVISYVTPTGAKAASAGTYILYASSLAAMTPGTHIGAATPVNMLDKPTHQHLSTVEKKAINDSAAYIKTLARLYSRNELWAEHAVRDASSISAEEAKQLHVIEEIANNLEELLHKIDNRPLKVNGKTIIVNTRDLQLERIVTDWRYQFLSFITHPNVIYLLLLLAIYGIFFELSNPGLILPGVAGVIALILSFYALHLLPINYTGFSLLLAGLTFMALEVYVTSYGILGLGGIIAFIIGSLMLFDGHNPYYHLTISLAFIMSIASFIFFYVLLQLAIQSHKKAIITGKEGLIHQEGIVINITKHKIFVKVLGEIWEATSAHPLSIGDRVKVTASTGLILHVNPIKQ